jgi:hypothetical protein
MIEMEISVNNGPDIRNIGIKVVIELKIFNI